MIQNYSILVAQRLNARDVDLDVKKTTEQFIADAKAVHGNRYDYSKAEYVNSKSRLTIICPEHGDWQQTPANHLTGFGCKLCGFKNAGQYHKKDTLAFVDEAQKVHGHKYNYSATEYRGAREKLTIVCPVHGPFEQTAGSHLAGKGCSACSYEHRGEQSRMPYGEFVTQAHAVHGNFFDYSSAKEIFGNSETKIPIVCPQHGFFKQSPANHLKGNGCPICRSERMRTRFLRSAEDFIAKANSVHGNAYDYSSVEYKGAHDPVTIICQIDGSFQQSPTSHLSGTGCPICSRRGQGAPRNLVRALRGEFDAPKDAFVYVITFRVPSINGSLFKVGSGSGTRLRSVLASIRKIGGSVDDVLTKSFETTGEAIVYEHLAHDQIMECKVPLPKALKFPGYSEVFDKAPDLGWVDDHPTLARFRSEDRWDPRAQ